MKRGALLLMLAAALPWSAIAAGPAPLTLDRAVRMALDDDPWLEGSRQRETALVNEAVAAGELPNPTVSLTASNLPTDGFALDQEPMTQLALGVTQRFPRGDTRELAQRRKSQLGSRQPFLRADRRARVTATVSRLWLDVFEAQESIRLIERDRILFEHLVDAAEAKYATAMGRTRLQDVVRAQLELTRLDERLTTLAQRRDAARQQLAEWVGVAALAPVRGEAGALEPAVPVLLAPERTPSRSDWYQRVRAHPAVLALDRRIDAAGTKVDLARQQYAPEWGLTARYGYREDEPTGADRADLFTVGVTFDLPIFTGNRQDRTLAAASARAEVVRSERSLLVRELVASLGEARDQLLRLDERRRIYDRRLLPQMRQQAEAALTAYYNDDGDFAEAVRAHIDELNAKIDALDLAVSRARTVARINYLLAQGPDANQSAPAELPRMEP